LIMAPKAAAKAAAPKAEAKAKAKAKAKVKKEEEVDEGPKMQAPDREAFNASLEKVQKDIDDLQKEQKSVAARIGERSGGKDDFFQKKTEIRSRLDEVSGKMNELHARKDALQKQVGAVQGEAREKRQQLNDMKKSMGFRSEQEIDERIASIEFKMWTESVPLKEEKKLLLEIQELKRKKPQVSSVNKLETEVSNFDSGASVKEQIQAINAEMAPHRDAKRVVQEELSALMEKRKEELGDMPQLIEERDAISKKIREKIEERNKSRDDYRALERDYNAFLGEQRRVRQEKYAGDREKERKEWDLKRKEREIEKLDDQPYVSEITLVEQTIKFCKSLMPRGDDESAGKEKKEIEHNVKEGEVVLAKKSDRDEDYYQLPTKTKKAAKSKGPKTSKSIKHNAETFKLFDQLKLDAPITTEEIPGILEKLDALAEDYKAKVEKWNETREERKQQILDGIAVEEERAEKREDEEKEEDKNEPEEEKEEENDKDEAKEKDNDE